MTRSGLPARANEVLEFWIGDADEDASEARRRRALWFGGSPEIDAAIRQRFAQVLRDVRESRCDDWLDTAHGQLAQIIVLDQFPRNMFRGTAEAFSCDTRALTLSLALADAESFGTLGWMSRAFTLMPMQHAEDEGVQARSVRESEALARDCPEEYREILEGNARFAREHRDIVVRFGRFPHRNRVLGRESTAKETAWLADGAPTFGQG